MSHCHFLSKAKNRSCAKYGCKCDRTICFCQTKHAPVNKKLPEKLAPGTCITVDGRIESDCSRFAVNLACSEDGDVALHLNPRLCQKYIMRNSRTGGKWGEPEVTSSARFVLERNKPFLLNILITTREFLIAVNGKHFCGYVFRFPPRLLKILQVFGLVKIHRVEYHDLESYPPELPAMSPVMLTTGENFFTASRGEVELPLTAFLVRGFREGFQMEINGKIKVYPCGFYVSFQEGPAVWPPPNLHLHIDFSFDPTIGKHQVLVNARKDGNWGRPIVDPRFFFHPKSRFNIIIYRSKSCFRVSLAGDFLADFELEGNQADMIDTLNIQGDIIISSPIDISSRK